jgi:hypothetical protein
VAPVRTTIDRRNRFSCESFNTTISICSSARSMTDTPLELKSCGHGREHQTLQMVGFIAPAE